MKFGSCSWLAIYTKSIPHLQRSYSNNFLRVKHFLKGTKSQGFTTTFLKKETAHKLTITEKSANTAFYLKPSRRRRQSPQPRVKIKSVFLLPPADQPDGWPQRRTMAARHQHVPRRKPGCTEDQLSSALRATEVGIPSGSPHSVQIDSTPLFSSANSLPVKG